MSEHGRWGRRVRMAVAVAATGFVLAGTQAASARGSVAPVVGITQFFGPISLGSGQELILHGRNVSDPASPMVELAFFDATGVMTISLSAAVSPDSSIDLFQTGTGYFWARVRSTSALVRGSLEMLDATTLQVIELTGPTPVLRGGANMAVGGPVEMSDENTEVVAFANLTNNIRTVTITFYDDLGTILSSPSQTIGSHQTATMAFPATFEGNFIAYEMSVSGNGPAILATFLATDANGLLSAYNEAATI